MNLKKNNQVQLNKYYWGNQYEFETGVAGSKEILYLGGDAYSAAAVYVKEGSGAWVVYYLCGDYLGNITHIVNSSGVVKQELSYDVWGRLRNPVNQALYAVGTEPVLFLGRGYTGHEHLTAFGLINMNARLYDPVIGRFLSPDPRLQNPYSSQNYNRYSYCLNNPLVYTDPNGEFFLGYMFGFFRGLFSKKPWKAFEKGWKGGVNEVKMWGGLFATGSYMNHQSHRNFWTASWELISRFTWQLPQTMIGHGYAQFSGYAGQVDNVDYWGGATVMSGNNWGQKAVTLSSFIIGDRTISADPNNSVFQHEYGHYLQSQSMGWGYLSRIGIPSLMSADGSGEHKYQPHEQDANARAFLYFNRHVSGFYQTEAQYDTNIERGNSIGWNFKANPLDINYTGKGYEYRDYHNLGVRNAISDLKLDAKWYDHVSWLVPVIGPIGVGIYNSSTR